MICIKLDGLPDDDHGEAHALLADAEHVMIKINEKGHETNYIEMM